MIPRWLKDLLLGWMPDYQHRRRLEEDLGDPKELEGLRVRFLGWKHWHPAEHHLPVGSEGVIESLVDWEGGFCPLVRWEASDLLLIHPTEELEVIL